ncbi:transposase [Brucella anthropi]|uniref:IS66-like element accessory protein TnpA n=1 Tax=Brucella anthropi TaxID=529 RepID=UPI00124CB533|nr:transposase [Brucella anthropi]KAB2774447.1 transposase [Brucella anthropi]
MSSHRIDLPNKGVVSRRWPAALKEEIVLATLEAGASVASVARRYELDSSQIYQWRKALKVSRLPLSDTATLPEFLSVEVCATEPDVRAPVDSLKEVTSVCNRQSPSSSSTGMIEIEVGSRHRVRVSDGFLSDTLDRVLDVLRRHR